MDRWPWPAGSAVRRSGGELHGDGVAYYAAHLVTQRVRQVGASVDQRTADPGGEGVMSTFYGQQYEALRLTLPLTGFVV